MLAEPLTRGVVPAASLGNPGKQRYTVARKADVQALKARAQKGIEVALERIKQADRIKANYALVRWMTSMTAVELHAIWERYGEARIVAALNHDAAHFIMRESIVGVSHVSMGLASFVVRGGNKFFDFRSMDDLINKANRWLGDNNNPFRAIAHHDRKYIDVLAATRNCVVHGSDAAWSSYRAQLRKVYVISSAPAPDEFLNAKDNRQGSPLRYQTRLRGLASVLDRAIGSS